MKLPKFLRGSEEEKPEAVDLPEEESKIIETVSPAGETEEAAPETGDALAAISEASEQPAEPAAWPMEEEKLQVEAEEPAGLMEEARPPQEESLLPVEGKPLEEIEEGKPVLEETGLPSPEKESGQLPVSEELPVPEPTKPSWFRRFIKWMFNKETRVGRVMRQLALFAAVFGLGLLFAYLVWIAPQARQVSVLAGERQQVVTELNAAEDARLSVETELADTQAELAEAQEEAQVLEARLHLAKASYQAAKAQLSIVEKQGADALAALEMAKTEVAALNGYLAGEDPDVATEIEARLTAAKSALVRDPDLALTDLETLITLLAQQDKILAGK